MTIPVKLLPEVEDEDERMLIIKKLLEHIPPELIDNLLRKFGYIPIIFCYFNTTSNLAIPYIVDPETFNLLKRTRTSGGSINIEERALLLYEENHLAPALNIATGRIELFPLALHVSTLPTAFALDRPLAINMEETLDRYYIEDIKKIINQVTKDVKNSLIIVKKRNDITKIFYVLSKMLIDSTIGALTYIKVKYRGQIFNVPIFNSDDLVEDYIVLDSRIERIVTSLSSRELSIPLRFKVDTIDEVKCRIDEVRSILEDFFYYRARLFFKLLRDASKHVPTDLTILVDWEDNLRVDIYLTVKLVDLSLSFLYLKLRAEEEPTRIIVRRAERSGTLLEWYGGKNLSEVKSMIESLIMREIGKLNREAGSSVKTFLKYLLNSLPDTTKVIIDLD